MEAISSVPSATISVITPAATASSTTSITSAIPATPTPAVDLPIYSLVSASRAGSTSTSYVHRHSLSPQLRSSIIEDSQVQTSGSISSPFPSGSPSIQRTGNEMNPAIQNLLTTAQGYMINTLALPTHSSYSSG
ncbi:UNVERIFIED_CONTAM: hypothetical protein FKN15_069120 [Acipenser sinensis]